jgi:catechol 2,3-dioxygenase-like lactoylglutathione lyase family enzyme
MTISRIDHVQLAMPPGGEKAARDFYEGLLGVPEVPKPSQLAARGGCWFECGAVKIHVGVDPDFSPARKAHPAFVFDDLARVVRTLEDAGYPIMEDQPLEGYERRYVHDPFGNLRPQTAIAPLGDISYLLPR